MFIATLALIELQKYLLLGEKTSGKFKGFINGPGGVQEPGESLVECVIRETQEELGITLLEEALRPVAVLDCFAAGELDFRVHVYWTNGYCGNPTETESMRPFWTLTNQLPYDRMHDGDRHWMPRALSQQQFNAHLFYQERGKGFMGIDILPYDPDI